MLMIDQSYLESLCDVHAEIFASAFYDAVSHFYDVHRAEILDISRTSKASYINDMIFRNLKQGLQNIPGFQIIENGNQRFIGYQSILLIRLKKLRKNRQPCVNQTRAALGFNTQENMGLFPEQATNVYLGYVLNDASGDIDQIAFVCPSSTGAIAWTIDIQEHSWQRTMDFDISTPKPTYKKRIIARNRKAEDDRNEISNG